MKKVFLLLICVMVILLSCSCAKEFSFREHHFGDSADQIRDSEGEPDDTITDFEDWESIVYPGIEILDEYEARLVYSLKDNGCNILSPWGILMIRWMLQMPRTR